ncbi:MAG: alpha/beta hydrolase [Sphingomonadaceae bacterium]|uniref:alpha/beta fold hydrolase n=1 Tax=Thermaurantiacus sp. TaxID=2820283 RepID=UPI00298EFA00|nr:alpha/beta fold hydrolase [Thermaurantiacus sp.]MCS6986556.1 alpha/beta hydrolase [Sphingomonadaceae bacterium]MDW8414183.1 alpha/beta fold hydrolase [Thermaurantiacus sp.]
MRLDRTFVDVPDRAGPRRVHLRVAGSGPPVLLVHQSPRSSAEYIPLMERWAQQFTVIAPDTPGFGDSAPLPLERPECEDYADALVALLDALGLERVAAYGFHSGAIILVTAARRHPGRFTALACGGYAVWDEEDRRLLGERYTPPFQPQPFGEHLVWLWGRLQEQSWFFPWYLAEPGRRLPMASIAPERTHPIAMECLAAGNGFTKGYAAVLRAKRDVPGPGEPGPPVLVAAFDGDPLQAHLERLGHAPPHWRIQRVATPSELEAAALAHLEAHPAPLATPRLGVADEGFVRIEAAGFMGLLHWKGRGDLFLHAPGSALSTARADGLALDLPGHGLSDPWPDAPHELAPWAEVVAAAIDALGATPAKVTGEGWSTVLAAAVASRLNLEAVPAPLPRGDRARWRELGIPDLTPDWAGTHLVRAWRMLRASTCFEPWFDVSAATARDFSPEELAPERLAMRHLALMRATAARPLLAACLDAAANSPR